MTPLLLDSHIVMWLSMGSSHLGAAVRQRITQAPVVYVSAVSAWELRQKQLSGKLKLTPDFEPTLMVVGLKELPLTLAHVAATRGVKLPHKDPFDRILVAQALVERLTLVTADRILLAAYPRQTLSALKPH